MTRLKVAFQKWEATGNDFLFIDAKSQGLELADPPPKAVRDVCHRETGRGADGVVLYTLGPENATMRIMNSDGSLAFMCGNALRCLAQILYRQSGRCEHRVKLHNREVVVKYLADGQSSVSMGPPSAILERALYEEHPTLSESLGHSPSHLVSFGNPHLVVPVETIPEDWRTAGQAIQEPSDRLLNTGGINCGFVELKPDSDGIHQLRVFERGVGETQSCGSGACAASVVLAEVYGVAPPHRLELSGGVLTLDRADDEVLLSGPARLEYQGNWEISE